MTVYANFSMRIAPRPTFFVGQEEPEISAGAPDAGEHRSFVRRLWSKLVSVLSGPGLDDSAFPSGFMAPYGRGSRQVRNLWHQPF